MSPKSRLAVLAACWAAAVSSAVAAGATASISGQGLQATTGFSDSASNRVVSVLNEGFFAPYGVAGIWGGANTAYPIRYAGAAEADPFTGRLRARIATQPLSNVPTRGGSAGATITGLFTLAATSPGAPVSMELQVQVDGLIAGPAGFASTLSIQSTVNPQTRFWRQRLEPPFGSNGPVQSFDEVYSLLIGGFDGESFLLTAQLEASASTAFGAAGRADFWNTSVLTLKPAAGTRFVPEAGFLTQVPVVTPVPEPAPALLLAAGLAALGWRARRR